MSGSIATAEAKAIARRVLVLEPGELDDAEVEVDAGDHLVLVELVLLGQRQGLAERVLRRLELEQVEVLHGLLALGLDLLLALVALVSLGDCGRRQDRERDGGTDDMCW